MRKSLFGIANRKLDIRIQFWNRSLRNTSFSYQLWRRPPSTLDSDSQTLNRAPADGNRSTGAERLAAVPLYDVSSMEYRTSVARSFMGVVKVDIACIEFNKEAGLRELDPNVTEHLKSLFTGYTEGPDTSQHLESTRLRWDNHIEAEVEPGELDRLLRASNLTKGDLWRSISGADYPKLHVADKKLQCLHGQHRLLAASEILEPGDRWWPVQIYSFEPNGECHPRYLQHQA